MVATNWWNPIGWIAAAVLVVEVVAVVVAVCDKVEKISKSIDNVETIYVNSEKTNSESYSVYFLKDDEGTIRYVGRVKDSGYRARMIYHYNTRGLVPDKRICGLTYNEARGLEEIGMIECHTLNKLKPIYNQIHGISLKNKRGETYIKAACDYLFNRAENRVLNFFE